MALGVNSAVYTIIFLISIIFYHINCEWVEIPQSNKRNYNLHRIKQFLPTTEAVDEFTLLPFHNRYFNISVAGDPFTAFDDDDFFSFKSNPKTRNNVSRFEVSTVLPNIETSSSYQITTVGENNLTSSDNILDETSTLRDDIQHPKTVSSIFSILKDVHETIKRNIHGTLRSKVKYLRNLREKLLLQIQDSLLAVWPSDNSRHKRSTKHTPEPDPRGSQSSRATQAPRSGYIDFPSPESALMTISFLTFSVFLIKLVMQVITAYKSHTMPVFTAMGRKVQFEQQTPQYMEMDKDAAVKILNKIQQFQANGK